MLKIRLLAVALVLAGAAAIAPWAEARGAKPGPAPKPPPGCEKLCDGRDACLALDGKRLAFVRWTTQGSQVDYHGDPIPRPRLFVRDLAAKKDAKVPNAEALPMCWTLAGGLGLSSGEVVDPRTGKHVEGTARLPEKVTATAVTWSRDGSRLAFVPDWQSTPLPPPGVPQVLAWVLADGTLQELGFGNVVESDPPASLAFSPDGAWLAYHVAYAGNGSLPFRRVAVVKVATGTQTVVSDMTQDNRVPGIHDERRPMRALPSTTGPRLGDAVWDAQGGWFAYVHGTGEGNADVYVCDAAGKEKRRQTKDGATKWGPALDAAGRRVGFFSAKVVEWPNGLEGRIVRVVDLLTQEVQDFPVVGSSGMPGNLTWTPDGAKLIYEVHGGDAEGVYAQAVPAAKAAPATAQGPGKVEVGQDDEVLGALAAGTPQRVEWACEQARAGWEARLVAPFREALKKALAGTDYRPTTDILRLLADMKVREALPEIRQALQAKDEHVVYTAIEALYTLRANEALADLETLRAKHASNDVRVRAAGVMAALGDARGWPQFPLSSKDKEADVRSSLCHALGRLPDPRSVTLLLGLVADDGFLHTSHGGDHVVGDEAVESLARLTGQFFRREAAAWTAWWKDTAKGALPASPDSQGALAKFNAWMDEREEAYQLEMKKKLERFLPPK